MAPDTPLALRIARVSVVAGLCLATLKISVGYWANSLAVIADGIESAGDVVASVILWLGLRFSAEPADENHPYGHGRVEILAGQAIGAFLITSGAILGWQTILHLQQPQSIPRPLALVTVFFSIGVKLFLARWKMRAARRFLSAALEADAANDWLDVLSGVVAICAVALNYWQPQRFPHADSVGSILIAALVIVLGFKVLRDSSWELLDTMPSAEVLAEIRACALSVPGALGIEKCRARKTGLQYHVDLHLEVQPDITVDSAHTISGKVRSAIRQSIPWVADVLIHIEPAPEQNKN
ncbi:cation diffusion facilitator family transporter [Bryobacter aggregatus]|uniref:cation diffusion facilitator family transporter n=1 Tax=Bryobacter aggregatus TaxID=360054 RepID=UPI0004E1E5FE|nr:cation diffusion facilitator family transporter [Bryobacter aggregatus]